MYSLTVRDHIMIAHSFVGAVFGPAQALHGATFVVEATFRRPGLNADGIVLDIGQASEVLTDVLKPLNFANLDDVPEYAGRNTTTEFLCGEIHRRLSARIAEGAFGVDGSSLTDLVVTLRESPDAWASFEGPVKAAGGSSA